MYVPVVTPAHYDDIAGKVEALSSHAYRLASREALHAVAANDEIRGLAKPQA